jgi:hypothetical protein
MFQVSDVLCEKSTVLSCFSKAATTIRGIILVDLEKQMHEETQKSSLGSFSWIVLTPEMAQTYTDRTKNCSKEQTGVVYR